MLLSMPYFDTLRVTVPSNAAQEAADLAAEGRCDRERELHLLAKWWQISHRLETVCTRYVWRGGRWEPMAGRELRPIGPSGIIEGMTFVGEVVAEYNCHRWPANEAEDCSYAFYLVADHVYPLQEVAANIVGDDCVITLPNKHVLILPAPRTPYPFVWPAKVEAEG